MWTRPWHLRARHTCIKRHLRPMFRALTTVAPTHLHQTPRLASSSMSVSGLRFFVYMTSTRRAPTSSATLKSFWSGMTQRSWTCFPRGKTRVCYPAFFTRAALPMLPCLLARHCPCCFRQRMPGDMCSAAGDWCRVIVCVRACVRVCVCCQKPPCGTTRPATSLHR